LRQFFFPDDFFPNQRNKTDTDTYRVGGRHVFSPNSVVLGSFTYQDAHFDANDPQVVGVEGLRSFVSKNPETSYGNEVQHIFRSQYVNLVSGVGYFDINGHTDFTAQTDFPPPADVIATRTGNDLKHTNVYTYSYINLFRGVTFTVGGSGDFTSG